jgi:hypothetical protein
MNSPGNQQRRFSADAALDHVTDYAISKTAENLAACVPTLGVSLKMVRGHYYFFHPGWFNIRWWWEEIIDYAEQARASLIDLQSHYIHQRALEDLKPGSRTERQLLANDLEDTLRTMSSQMEEVASKFFNLREKIAWLIYEMLRLTDNIYMQRWKVTYSTIARLISSTHQVHASDSDLARPEQANVAA